MVVTRDVHSGEDAGCARRSGECSAQQLTGTSMPQALRESAHKRGATQALATQAGTASADTRHLSDSAAASGC
jgi:hypothetical protein